MYLIIIIAWYVMEDIIISILADFEEYLIIYKMLARRRWPPRYCASLGLDGLLDRDRCEERVEGGEIMGISDKLLLNLSISDKAAGEKFRVFRLCSVRASNVRQAALGRFDVNNSGGRERARFIRVNAMFFWPGTESQACLGGNVTCQARWPKTNNAKTNKANVTRANLF
jgi:hypothetical protein